MSQLDPTRSFASLGVPAPIVSALADDGVTEPFPIQAATLVDSLAGKDLLGRGKTGSGKTIAFAIPVVATLAKVGGKPQPNRPRALVLVPTRELANQVAATIAPLARAMKLRYTTVYGGVGFGNQISAMRGGVDIVVACPGRLEDLIKQGHCSLDRVAITVLDEADHMADMGFLPVVKRLLDATPKTAQRLLFSATLDNDVKVLVDRYMKNPVTHALDPADSPVEQMTHHLLSTTLESKLAVVSRLANGPDRSLLFTRTKHGAKKLVRQLGQAGIPAVELHGNLSQGARERNLADFSSGEVKVLVATDIAARGIHVDDVALVVHVDPPAEHKAFLHRSGRTARAGAAGVVATVMVQGQQKEVRSMMKAAGITPILTESVGANHDVLGKLAGPEQPSRGPIPVRIAQNPAPAARGPKPGGHGGKAHKGPKGGHAGAGYKGPKKAGRPGGQASARPAAPGSARPAGQGSGRPAGQGSGRPAGQGSGRPAGQGSGRPAGRSPGAARAR